MGNSKAIMDPMQGNFMEIVRGPGAGQKIDLGGGVLTIGRTEGNDLVLANDSVSRHHATLIQQMDGGYVLRDEGSKNGMVVNGEKKRQTLLKEGDLVQVGEFVLRFHRGNSDSLPANIDEEEAPLLRRRPQFKVPSKRVLIYGGVGLVILLLLMFGQEPSSTSPPTAKKEVASVEAPQLPQTPKASLKSLEDPSLSSAEKKLERYDFSNERQKEAEQYFRRGQREYLAKSYLRAKSAFETALSFDQGHPLAMYYLRLTIYEMEKDAKKNFELGVKYFDSLQYSRAIYHFKQVVEILSYNPGDKRISEAEKYMSVSQKVLQAAELFP